LYEEEGRKKKKKKKTNLSSSERFLILKDPRSHLVERRRLERLVEKHG